MNRLKATQLTIICFFFIVLLLCSQCGPKSAHTNHKTEMYSNKTETTHTDGMRERERAVETNSKNSLWSVALDIDADADADAYLYLNDDDMCESVSLVGLVLVKLFVN